MIPPQTTEYREALAAPHQSYGRVEVWRGGIKIDELNQYDPVTDDYAAARPVFYGGSIRATLTSRVSRTLTMTVPDWLFPWETTDLLNPYGTYLHCYRGVRYGSGTVDEFPTFKGPITGVRPSGGGRLTVGAADLAYEVVRNGFAGPQPAHVGTYVVDEYRRLVREAYPSATFADFDEFWEVVPSLSYDADRGSSLDNLAKTASAFWYALAGGDFTLRRVPWTVPITGAPIVMSDGDGGTLFTAYPDRSSEGIHNRIVLSSERVDGGVPVYALAEDTDSSSPTWIEGPFLIKSTQVRVTAGLNQGQVADAARTLLARTKARTTSWQMTCTPDASIELGDPLSLTFKGRSALQITAGFSIPLEGGGVMSIDGRDLVSSELDA